MRQFQSINRSKGSELKYKFIFGLVSNLTQNKYLSARTQFPMKFFISFCLALLTLTETAAFNSHSTETTDRNLPSLEMLLKDIWHDSLGLNQDMPEVLIPFIIVVNDVCGQGIGSLDLVPDPGGPYTFEWSNGAMTEDISGLTAGTYTVTITDQNGNKQSVPAIVGTAPPIVPNNVNGVVSGNTLCNGMGDGAIDLTVTPNMPPDWTYTWSNGDITEDIANLVPGTYTVTITYGVTCTTLATYVVPNLTNAPNLGPPIGGFPGDQCETGNGSAAIVATGGVQPFTYLWSNGETTFNISNLTAGTYTVTVTGANGCSNEYTGDVPATTLPVQAVLVQKINNTLCVGGNGSIDINVTPNAALTTATYSWSNGETTQDISGLVGGYYTVTVTRLGNCTSTMEILVSDVPNKPKFALLATKTTCGMSNGSIVLNVQPGGPPAPYTYEWSNGETTSNLNGIPPGDYTVTVTGSNGCTETQSITVEDTDIGFSFYADVVPHTACDTLNGQLTLHLSPSNLTYEWSTGDSVKILRNLPPGNYSVTVSAGGTCTGSETYTIDDLTEYPSIPAAPIPSLCGLANGGVDLTINGGQAPFEVMWSTGDTSQDLSQLLADTFYVTVTSAVGCSATNFAIVPNLDPEMEINGMVSDNNSCAFPNGSVILDVIPVDTNLLSIWSDTSLVYLWSDGEDTDSLLSLSGGTYMVTVSLGATCIVSDTFDIVNNAISPTVSATGTAATCSLDNGAADLDVSGAVAPYTFLWSTTDTLEDLSNLTPGTYTVTVTSANSCTAISTVNVINNNIALNINGNLTQNTSCTINNGAIDISVNPTGTFTYMWSNSEVTEDVSDLAPGNYSVTVALGSCQSVGNFTVLDNTNPPNLSSNITASICSLDNGAIDLSASGPSAPFTYEWSNLETTEDLSNLLSGNYTVTVTGTDGCTATAVYNVPNNAANFSLSASETDLTNCVTNNGAVDLTITPAGAYTFAWSNGEITEDLSNLAPGTYTVSVTSSGSCTATASYFVVDQRDFPSTSQSINPELCGLSDGSVDISVNGGTAPFVYSWNSGQVTEDLAGIGAGTYTVTVTDTNGCSATTSATVPGNSISFSLNGNAVPNSSCIQNNGAVDLTVNPAGNYTYLWSNTDVTEDLSALPAGTYTVTVSAGGNCTSTANFTITSNLPFPAITNTITPSFCGQADGAIDIAVSTSPSPHTYIWSTNDITQDVSGLNAGTYTVTVTAANGCSTIENYQVTDDVFTPTITSTQIANNSCIASTGAIDLTVTPAMAYTITWSNGSTTEDLTDLAAGNYIVTVSAGGSCTNTASIMVANNTVTPLLIGNTTDILCFGDNTGAIDLNVGTGTAPFTYNWSPVIAGNPEDPTGLAAGNYTVTVTDDLGCTASTSISVAQPASAVQLQCDVVNEVSEPGMTDGAGSVSIFGGTEPYFVDWGVGNSQNTVPSGIFPIPNLAENNYDVTVTDANGCPSICNFTITVSPCVTALGTMESTLLTLCGTGCVTAVYNPTGEILGPTDGFQFVLHEGNGNQIVNEIARSVQPTFCFDPATMSYGTTYYISAVAGAIDPTGNVDNAGYCGVTAVGTPVQFIEKPVAAISQPLPITCLATQTSLSGSSNILGSTFAWTTGSGVIVGNPNQATINASSAGTYTLIVSSNSCMDTAMVTVSSLVNQPSSNITASSGTTLDCITTSLDLSGTISGTSNGQTQWVNNGTVVGTNGMLSVTSPGQYQFIVLDTVSFCADTMSISIDQNLNPPSLSIQPPALLTCDNQSISLDGSSQNGAVQLSWASINSSDTTILGSGNSVSVSTPGTYYLFGIDPDNQCQNAVSVNVTADLTPPLAEAGQTYTLDCAGETAPLNGSGSGAPNLSYQWSTADGHIVSGANTSDPLIDLPGTYVLTVTNPANGCTASDDVLILPEVPEAFASVTQPSCLIEKGMITIDSVTGLSDPIQYALDAGVPGSQSQFSNLDPGTYTIAVLGENGCSASVTATVDPAVIPSIDLPSTALVDLGHTFQIDAQILPAATNLTNIVWTPIDNLSCIDCLNPMVSPTSSTTYQLLVTTEDGCELRSEILITVDKTRRVFVPNVFTPNGDGLNDAFNIFVDAESINIIKSFRVYSRWGEEVFGLDNFEPGSAGSEWDGTFNGDKLNPGVFVWMAIIEFKDGKEEVFSGDVTLIR